MIQSTPLRNDDVFEKLDGHAQSQYIEYFGDPGPKVPTRGPVEVDYWSISYKLAFPTRSIFVKIPKADMHQTDISSVVQDPRALESARTEFDGFKQIYSIRNWPAGCAAVRPLDYVSSFNSIITEYVPSEDLYVQCRSAGVRCGLPGRLGAASVHVSLNRCGAWLRHFQSAHELGGSVHSNSDQLLADIRLWAAEIRSLCVRPAVVDSFLDRLGQSPWSQEMRTARTCEGFEVRNVIVDCKGNIRLVDPGKVSWSSGLEDVAHFLVSLTMLYWGTPALWLGVPVSRSYRKSFLDGWMQRDRPVNPAIMAWFEAREWFRQWLEAYRVVSRKPYSSTARRVLRAVYVDAFFLNRIADATARAVHQY